MNQNNIKYGIYVGRFSPIHRGHQEVIVKMVTTLGYDNTLLLIGSCASPLSDRLFFTYHQRKALIRTLYPKLNLCGLPDYKDVDNDPEYYQWYENLWDIIQLKFPDATIDNVVFFGGSLDDLFWAKNKEYNICLVDRTTTEYSGTLVRSHLLANINISHLIDPKIMEDVYEYYYANFKKEE